MSVTMIAGPIAGVATCCIFYPLDTIKTRLQSPEYRKAVMKEGVRGARYRGLYQGIGPVLIAALPASGAFFTTYKGSQRFLNSRAPELPTPLINSISSASAELIATAVGAPAEVIKQNAQVLKGRGTSLRALKLIGRNPRNFWRGYTLLAGRNLPFIGLQFPLYEELKVLLGAAEVKGDWWAMSKVTAMAAGLSGGVAAWITTPIDVVKTRTMLSASGGEKKGAREIVRGILREEGVKELFRGGGMRLFWTMVGSGMYLAIYEGVATWLGETTERTKAR